jgi:hypothetical protein
MVNNQSAFIFKTGDLLLVEDDRDSKQSNFVKIGLSLLREAGLRPPIQFVTLDSILLLNKTLSLKALISQHVQEQDLKAFMFGMKNKSLCHLLETIHYLECPLKDASPDQLNILTLTLSLLSDRPYLIYDNPEQFLHGHYENVFFDALQFELLHNKKIAFIRSDKPQIWEPMANKKVILKGAQTSIVPLIKDKIRAHFLEINKHTNPIRQKEGLEFYWPENNHKKSA